jgi:two-component system, OmpR family, phosphate regulon sensor histidine kinase PhoR
MASGSILRAVAGAAAAATGLFLALYAGAPLAAALFALVAGGLAVALLWPSNRPAEGSRTSTAAPPFPLPEAAELLELIADPMLIVRNRRIQFANRSARSLLGEHIDGIDVRLAIRHPAAAERLIDRGRGEPAEVSTRTELVGLGEPDRRWEMTTSLFGDGSRLVRLTDKSESHASEQMRTDFVANASHELRTPLATLLGFLETLQDEAAPTDEETRSRFLRIMFDEAKRMHRLVDDLISLSRIEAERFSLPRESVPLLPLIEEVRATCAMMIAEKGSEIRVEDEVGNSVVLGDRSQLLQLLQNLIVNALKYGAPGSPVTVRFKEVGAEMLRMSVEDSGEGIAPEHLPRLTERFYRVDPSRSRAMGGTGLGLAIVKHIVGRHRGRLDIRSKPGEGTSVRVYLPLAPPPVSSKSHATVTQVTRNGPSEVASLD